jgi:UDP-N-acetylmuramoyl-tripeptide--D-alanyl-D-alanine ligase
MNLKLSDICEMCSGELSVNSNPDLVITNVAIDSRNATNGSLFVAIIGENNDGHDYVFNLVTKYQAAALVNKHSIGEFNNAKNNGLNQPNLIYVNDTVKALGELAHNYRQRFMLPVIGITGSNGKTTVKEMLKSICSVKFGEEYVLATTGNLNNHLGVPLTLLALENKHQVAIIEMGMNHSGELDYLTKIVKPTAAVVNNVMLAHAGFFNDLTDIARAKGEIYNSLGVDGIAYVNVSIPEHVLWIKKLEQQQTKYVKYGNKDSGYFVEKLTLKSGANAFRIITPNDEIEINLPILGKHNQKKCLNRNSNGITDWY